MITLVIPCIPEHLGNLEKILDDYICNTIKPSQTVVSLSNTEKINNQFVKYLINNDVAHTPSTS